LILTPHDVPLVTDLGLARSNPGLAVFSAYCHGRHGDADMLFPAVAEALRSLGPSKALFYYDVVLAGLPPAARLRWEEFMTATLGHEYQSDVFREIATKHEGLGEARAILIGLEARGVSVSQEAREKILACTDLATLDTWVRRASTASTADEVIRD
jgi:hypothetical protein